MIDTSRLLLKFIPTKECSDQTTYTHKVDTSGELQHLMAKKEFIHRIVDAETGQVVKGIHIYRDGDSAIFVDTASCKRLFSLEEFFFGEDKSVEFDVNYMMYDGPVCSVTPITEQTVYNAPSTHSAGVAPDSVALSEVPLSASVSGTSASYGGFFSGGWMSKLALAGLGLAGAGYAYAASQEEEADVAKLEVNPTNGVELSGRGEPGSTINIDINNDGVVEHTVVVANDGSWSFKPDAPITTNNIKITSSPEDVDQEVVVELDTQAPGAPTAELDDPSDSGTKDDGITTDTTPTIGGAGTPGDTITVVIPGTGEVITTIVNAQGSWGVTVTQPLADGTSGNIQVTATDPAGNVGPAATTPLTIDLSAPAIPTGTLDESSDTGTLGDAITADLTPTISGTGTPGDTITVVMPGTGETVTTIVANDSTWSVVPTQNISNGTSADVVITATDPAGNTSGVLNVPITIDNTATGPSADLAADSDTGTSTSDGITSDATPEIVGTGEPGDTITVTMPVTNEELITTVDTDGNWTVTALQAIPHGTSDDISIVATDSSGNESTPVTVPITIDTTAPATPTAELDPASDTGTAGDNTTTDTTPTIRGTGEPGATVNVIMPDTDETLTATIDTDGNWQVTATQPIATGTDDNVNVHVVDTAGNISPVVTVPLEVVAPVGPDASIDATSDTGASTTDGITSDTTPTVKGTGTPGDTIKVTFPGTNEEVVETIDGNGDWTATATQPIAHGVSGNISVVSTDAGGVESPAATLPLTIDTTAPATPTAELDPASDTGTAGDSVTTDTTPTIRGTGEPGSSVTVTMPNTNESLTVDIDENGDWSVTATQPIALGTDDVASVRVTDPAGNISPIQTVDLVITSDNSPTFATGASADITNYDEGDAAVALVDPATFGITDANSTDLTSAVVTIKEGFAIGDMLTWTDAGAVTGDYNPETGVLTFTGTDTLANYEAALESVKFSSVGVASGVADESRTIAIQVSDDTAGTPLVSQEHTISVEEITPAIGTQSPDTEVNNFTEDSKIGLAQEGQVVIMKDGTQVTVTDTKLLYTNPDTTTTTRTHDVSVKFYNPDGTQTDWIDVEIDELAVGTTQVNFYDNPTVTDFSYTDNGGTEHSVIAVGATTQDLVANTVTSYVSLIENNGDGTVTVLDTYNLGNLPGVSLDQLDNGDMVVTTGAYDTTTSVLSLDKANGILSLVDSHDHNYGYGTDKISVTATDDGGFIHTFASENRYYDYDEAGGATAITYVDSVTINSTNAVDGMAGALEPMSWTDAAGTEYFVSTNDSEVFVVKLDPDAATATDALTQTQKITFDTNYTDTANPNGLGLSANADQIQFTDIGNGKALVVFGETDAQYNGQLSAGIWDMNSMEFEKPIQNNVLENYFDPVSVAYDPDTGSVILGGEMPFDHGGNALYDPTFYRFTLNDEDHGSTILVKCVGFVEVANEGQLVKPFGAISFNDADSTDLALVKISIEGGYDASADTLRVDPDYTLPPGVDVLFNQTTGNLLITGVDQLADYQEVLGQIEFSSTSATEGNRSLDVTAYDKEGNQDETPLTMVIQVQDPTDMAGTAGDDQLDGGIDIDKLIGGQGDDVMTGGFGQDIFVWNAGDDTGGAADTITDFTQCFQDDKLDLSGLLVGETNDAAALTNFLSFASDGTDTTISISTDGASATTQTIKLEGIDLTNSGAATDTQIIQSLLDDNQLIVG